jgi:hypothetical protein
MEDRMISHAVAGLGLAWALFATSAAQAMPLRPTPQQFRAHRTASPYNFWSCKAGRNGVGIHSRIGGPVSGRLPSGKQFSATAAAYDAHRHVWYQVPFVYQSPLKGWVDAADVTCDATSAD